MQMLIVPGRQLFICDTHINRDPTPSNRRDDAARRGRGAALGVKPSVALLSHSSFGSSDAPSAQKMRDALELIIALARSLASKARCARLGAAKGIRDEEFPDSRLAEDANLLSCRTSTPPTSRTTRCGDRRRRHYCRRDSARCGEGRAHHDAVVDRAAHRQHDGGGGRRRGGGARQAVAAGSRQRE